MTVALPENDVIDNGKGLSLRDGTVLTLRMVPINELYVDDSYQRKLDVRRVERMSKRGILWAELGSLAVAERDDGSLHVYDGQHRLRMLERCFEYEAPCTIVSSGGCGEEARWFRESNTHRTATKPIQTFWALMAEEGPEHEAAMTILDTVERCGFSLNLEREGYGPGPHSIDAVATVQTIFGRGGELLLEWTLRAIEVAWPGQPSAVNVTMLRAVSWFCAAYMPSEKATVKAMGRKFGRKAAADIVSGARLRSKNASRSVEQTIFQELLDMWNLRVPLQDQLQPLSRNRAMANLRAITF